MTKEECIALLYRYAEYNGIGIPNLAGCKEAMKKAADLLSQHSLPSDLDETAQKVEDYYDVGEERGYLYCHRGDIKDAFKAGAQWMAEQGATVRKKIGKIDDGVNQIPTYCNGFEVTELDVPFLNSKECGYGSEVIVQIRKK